MNRDREVPDPLPDEPRIAGKAGHWDDGVVAADDNALEFVDQLLAPYRVGLLVLLGEACVEVGQLVAVIVVVGARGEPPEAVAGVEAGGVGPGEVRFEVAVASQLLGRGKVLDVDHDLDSQLVREHPGQDDSLILVIEVVGQEVDVGEVALIRVEAGLRQERLGRDDVCRVLHVDRGAPLR